MEKMERAKQYTKNKTMVFKGTRKREGKELFSVVIIFFGLVCR